jgi:hypothetical protein
LLAGKLSDDSLSLAIQIHLEDTFSMIQSSFTMLARAAARPHLHSSFAAPAAASALTSAAGASRLRARYYSEEASSKATEANATADKSKSTEGDATEDATDMAMKKVQKDFEKADKELAKMKVRRCNTTTHYFVTSEHY